MKNSKSKSQKPLQSSIKELAGQALVYMLMSFVDLVTKKELCQTDQKKRRCVLVPVAIVS